MVGRRSRPSTSVVLDLLLDGEHRVADAPDVVDVLGGELVALHAPDVHRAALVAGAEDLQGVGDVGEAVLAGDPVGPALDRRAFDLDRPSAAAADEVVVVAGAALAVAHLAVVAAQGVDLARRRRAPGGCGRPSTGRPSRRAAARMSWISWALANASRSSRIAPTARRWRVLRGVSTMVPPRPVVTSWPDVGGARRRRPGRRRRMPPGPAPRSWARAGRRSRSS